MIEHISIRLQSGGYEAWVETQEGVSVRLTSSHLTSQQAHAKATEYLSDPTFRQRWHKAWNYKYTLPAEEQA